MTYIKVFKKKGSDNLITVSMIPVEIIIIPETPSIKFYVFRGFSFISMLLNK